MSADPALDLVVAYLRLNGYFLITEQHGRGQPPTQRCVTPLQIGHPALASIPDSGNDEVSLKRIIESSI